jgi:branched-chain amino acid transport system ATP-binding protein
MSASPTQLTPSGAQDAPGAVVLEAEGVTVAFGGLVAVDSVSFEIREGEILGLIGPNGAGKTSVLNAVSGVVPTTAGRVTFEGNDVTGVPLHKRIGLGIARTFQGVELFPALSVLENLMVGRHHLMRTNVFTAAIFYGPGRRQEIAHRKKVEEIVDFLELYPYRHHAVGSLPFGIQKLIGLGRALCAEPRLLLLDEVASGLNREEREDLARFMLRIQHEQRIPIVWVEHDVRLVSDLADRVVALHYGKKIGEGRPGDVLALDEVRRSFLGTE